MSKLSKICRRRKSFETSIKHNTKSNVFLRCKDWLSKQRHVESFLVQPYEQLLENGDDIPTEGASSLSHLKLKKTSEIKRNIYFSCEWKHCAEQFENEENLQDHVLKHIVVIEQFEGKYCCDWDLCYFKTSCNAEITRHVHYHAYHTMLKTFGESICETASIPGCTNDSRSRNTVPDLKSDFNCAWDSCGRTFKSIYLFHKHTQLHCTFERDAQQIEKPAKKQMMCKWEGCESKFNVIYRLLEHVRKHTNEKIVGCSHCGGIFRSNTVLFNHCKRQLANNTQEFQCAECFKYFASEQLLRQHVVVHVNCLKCAMCNMTCNNSYTLAKHIRYRHLTERPFTCVNCQKPFVCKSDLVKHVERMHEKKIFECGEIGCNFSCKALFLLKRHDAEFHGESPAIYACHCCEKIYKSGKSLSHHLIKSHGFQLPSGHSRFWYRLDESGIYRLQTMRIESLEVTKQILSPTIPKADNYTEISNEFEVKLDNDVIKLDLNNTAHTQECLENNILISISDVDKDGNVLDTNELEPQNKMKSRSAYCGVPQCTNYRTAAITMHHIPKNVLGTKDLRKKWRIALRMGKDFPKNFQICSAHFKNYAILRPIKRDNKPTRFRLMKGAFPTENLPKSSVHKLKIANPNRAKRLEARRIKIFNTSSNNNLQLDTGLENNRVAATEQEFHSVSVQQEEITVRDIGCQVNLNKSIMDYLWDTDAKLNTMTGIPSLQILEAMLISCNILRPNEACLISLRYNGYFN